MDPFLPQCTSLLFDVLERTIDNRGKTPPFADLGYPLVEVKHIQSGRLYPVLDDTKFVDQHTWNTWFRGHLEPGDILFSTVGSIARSCIVPDTPKLCIAQNVLGFRVNKSKADPRYIYYAINGAFFQQEVHGRTIETVQKSIKVYDLKTARIPLPTLDEQHAIAHILGTLDDKIELNRRMNETLEAIARALFKSWFVDFDPVRAKAAGRQPAGIDAETAALFPEGFEQSALGEIPRGWEVRNLPQAFEVNPPRSLRNGQTAPYLEMSNMPTSSARALAWENRPFGSGMKFINGDTLVARITPCLENGKTAFVDFLAEGEVGWGSTEYIVLHSKPPFPLEYTYFLARSDDFRTHAIRNMTGTSGRQRVPVECFNSYKVVLPPKKIAEQFGKGASSLLRTMKAHDEESATLAAIRDALLPKLLSGEIRVKEAEKLVEAKI